uniref:ANK_REP_REGION domain-containing protein n=1 Tax=Brugia timori TaxID=42155 RepID=A0A0R3R2S0_9BILA
LKTKTQPAVYYLPLSEEQITERIKRKAAEAELAKKVAQNGTMKRKEKDEPSKEKTNTSKRVSARSPPSRRRSRTPPSPDSTAKTTSSQGLSLVDIAISKGKDVKAYLH